ncbi:MAG: glycosyltransferase family 87 protein [Planctomycetota bacterium]
MSLAHPRAPWQLWLPRLRSIMVIAVGAWLIGHTIAQVWHFTIDDAGISYAYAKHWATGAGSVAVIGGPRIEGYSNFLWVAVLALTAWSGWAIPTAAKALGVACGVGALLLSIRTLQRQDGRHWSHVEWTDAVPFIVGALSLPFVRWLPAGLENGCYALLIAATLLRDARESREPALRPWSAALAVGVALTRPEGVLYGVALGVIKVGHGMARPPQWRQAFTYWVWFAVLYGVYHGVHFAYYGDWVPNTYHAKQVATPGDGFAYLENFTTQNLPLYLLVPVAAGLWGNPRLVLPLVATLVCAAFFAVYSGGDWISHGRFLTPAILPIAILAARGTRRLAHVAVRPLGPPHLRGVASLVLVGGMGGALASERLPALDRLASARFCHLCERAQDVQVLDGLRRRLDLPRASLAISDFGAAAWHSSPTLQPIDLLGLCDATLARQRLTGDHAADSEAERARFQYLFHERADWPTFALFYRGQWPGFLQTPESREGYFELSRASLSRRGADAFLLHRGVLIDYFPPLERFAFRPLDEHLTLLGCDVERNQGATVELQIALLRRAVQPAPVAVTARLLPAAADAEAIWATPRWIADGMSGFFRRWRRGEPYPLRFDLTATRAGDDASVELGVRYGEGPWEWHPIATLKAARPRRSNQAAPAFPANLPAAATPELRTLQQAVAGAVTLRRQQPFAAEVPRADRELAAELVALTHRLQAAGDDEQAYLSLVLAARADPKVRHREATTLAALRAGSTSYGFSLELKLLRRYYATGADRWAILLASHAIERGHVDRARYFLGRVRDRAAHHDQLLALQHHVDHPDGARPPLSRCGPAAGIDGAFEQPGLRGWHRRGGAFHHDHPSTEAARPPVRGHMGAGILSSFTQNVTAATGELVSRPFTVCGTAMTFLIGGARAERGVGVELWVDDEVVHRAAGDGTHCLRPVVWNVAPWAGRPARVRIFDASARASDYLLVDDVRRW